jgi:hypothetical protein
MSFNTGVATAVGDTRVGVTVQRKKMPPPRRGGNGTDHEARLARVLRATGDDPASLVLMISVMERIIAERRPRRSRRVHADSY